jgi:hypothetical protein
VRSEATTNAIKRAGGTNFSSHDAATNANHSYVHRHASGAPHIHEKAVGRLYETLKLVLSLLGSGRRVEQVSRLRRDNSKQRHHTSALLRLLPAA